MIWDKIPWKDIEDYLDKTVGKTFDTLFSGMDSQEDEVKAKMDADLAKSRDLLADEIIYDSCKRTALIGGGAALPDLLPLGGWPMMIASIGTDFTLTLREELAMLSKLAYLYGQDASRELRQREAIGLLAAVKTGEGEPKSSATAEVSKLMAMMGAKHLSRKLIGQILKEIGKRFYKRKLIALIPGVGIFLSGGVNFISTRSLGEYAKAYYQRRKTGNSEVDGIVSEIQHFQKCYLQVMVNMAKVDKKIPREEEDLLKDSLLMFGFSREEQAGYFRELYDLEIMTPVTSDDVRKLSEDDRRYIVKQAMAMMMVDRRASLAEKNYLDMLRKLFGINSEAAVALQREVEEELGAIEEE
ncbi:MAG: DUF533 domain-containing protein [Candidatus Wallbacteria bacterium]|nr:DUF533 domain-containing protein [Candidatus Wallbacteria bacterium]